MTNRDFFKILIKVVGLYFFIQVLFTFLPSQIGFLNFNSDSGSMIGTTIYVALILLFIIGLLYFLIRFPEKIIDLFKLDQNFDQQKISINNFNQKNILTIALIIIGSFLVIENINTLLSGLYLVFRKSMNPLFPISEKSSIALILPALNLLLGGILLTFRNSISNYFEK